jgi:hypothetical protein
MVGSWLKSITKMNIRNIHLSVSNHRARCFSTYIYMINNIFFRLLACASDTAPAFFWCVAALFWPASEQRPKRCIPLLALAKTRHQDSVQSKSGNKKKGALQDAP